MKTAIMTDSNSGIVLKEKAEELGIFLLHMPVLIDNKEYSEGIDITSKELYEFMDEDKSCSTSQPSPGTLTEKWENILSSGYDEIVYIPMSSALSSSCESARMFAQDFDSRVCVADNQRISVSQMEAALDAKRMADAGKSAKEIVEHLENTARRASIYLAVDSLKYLQKSGRLNATSAIAGTVLNIKPILSIQGEKLEPFVKVRGMQKCKSAMIEALKKDLETRFAGIPEEKLRIATAGTLKDSETAEKWRAMVQEKFPGHDVYYDNLPCSIACHIGPECMGIGVTVIDEWK